jgi:hypothetical protein
MYGMHTVYILQPVGTGMHISKKFMHNSKFVKSHISYKSADALYVFHREAKLVRKNTDKDVFRTMRCIAYTGYLKNRFTTLRGYYIVMYYRFA